MATKTESERIDQRFKELEQGLYRGSILNWDCWQSRDVKQLAGNVRAVSELALLAHKGLRATLDNGGTCSVDNAEWSILDDLLSMATLGSFVLARELGAGRRQNPRAEGRCVMETPRRSRSPRVTALVQHRGDASRPPAHVGARDGWRTDDRQARGHAPRGRHQRPAPSQISAMDVEPAGGAMTTWLRRQLEGLGKGT